MFDSNSIIDKIDGKVRQLQNYRQIFMEINTPEKLRTYRQELINFFFELEREIKVCAQLINTLSANNTNLIEKAEQLEKNSGDLYFENLTLKQKILIEENKIAEFTNSNKYLELQLDVKQGEIERLVKEIAFLTASKKNELTSIQSNVQALVNMI